MKGAMKIKTTGGAICFAAVSEKLKEMLKEKKAVAATKKMIEDLGPMLGKTVRVKKDMQLSPYKT